MTLKDYGPFKEKTLQLGPNLNVFYGGNGSGKTMLAGALSACFAKGALPVSCVPWDGGRPSLTIQYENDGDLCTITKGDGEETDMVPEGENIIVVQRDLFLDPSPLIYSAKNGRTESRVLDYLYRKLARVENALQEAEEVAFAFDQGVKARIDALENRREEVLEELYELEEAKALAEVELESARRQLKRSVAALEDVPDGRYTEEEAAEVDTLSHDVLIREMKCVDIDRRRANLRRSISARIALALPFVVGTVLLTSMRSLFSVFPALVFSGLAVSAVFLVISSRRLAAEYSSLSTQNELDIARLNALLSGETIDEYRDHKYRFAKMHEVRKNFEYAVAAAEKSIINLDIPSVQVRLDEADKAIAAFLEEVGFESVTEYRRRWGEYWGAINERTSIIEEINRVSYPYGISGNMTQREATARIEEAVRKASRGMITGYHCTNDGESRYREVYINPSGVWVSPESLGSGLSAMIRIIEKLASIDLKGKILVLDDPFREFDLNLLTKLVEFLSELAGLSQIIWFTLDKRVFELLPESAVQNIAEIQA